MKDPAFLFYPGDWMGGTLLLNRSQKGCYIDLLVAQFNNGPLTLEEIKTLLGSDFGQWPKIEKKFTFMDGRYYNKRLEEEVRKRSKFTSSRRSNASSSSVAQATKEHMEDENENINKDIYGEFKKVKLSKEEYEKLVERLGEVNTEILISQLDGYIEQNGKDKYSNHYATILNWARRKFIEKKEKVEKRTKTIIGL